MRIILLLSVTMLANFSFGQVVSTNTALPYEVKSALPVSPNVCTSAKKITFNVSGVGVLNNNVKELLEIRMTLLASSQKSNLIDLNCYITSPDGTCMQVASRMGNTSSLTLGKSVDYKFRNAEDCLNKQPDYGTNAMASLGGTANVAGASGIFSTVGNLATAFHGKNANGTWTIYFGRNGTGSTWFPDVTSASISFGAPMDIPADYGGGDCTASSAPIQWNGTPLCLTTYGKTSGKGMLPKYSGSGICAWNSENNNSIWIAFQPTSVNACISINGVANGQSQQSIVVTDNNLDGDNNPCTPTNSSDNSQWTEVSCPRDAIYGSTAGTTQSQNHCFTAVVGKTYYLVVDGSGGLQSKFYLSGVSGVPIILPVTFLSFEGTCEDGGINFKWMTGSETNNDFFTLDYSQDGEKWFEVATIKGKGNTSHVSEYTYLHRLVSEQEIGYYRLKQTDYNGTEIELETIAVKTCIEGTKKGLIIIPNPSNGMVHLLGLDENQVTDIFIFNADGKEVFSSQTQSNILSLDLSAKQKGVYLIQTISKSGETLTGRVVLQ